MKEDMKKVEQLMEKTKKQVEEKIKNIIDSGIKADNLDNLYKLIDIHKDLANEEYWKVEKEGEENEMRYMRGSSYNEGNYGRESYGNYDGYGNYNEGSYGRRQRDSRGRFMEGSYGRRYRGHDVIDEMYDHYGNYMEGKESGRYGNPEMSKALDYMLKSVEEFMLMLKQDASSQEEVEKIKHTARKISEM